MKVKIDSACLTPEQQETDPRGGGTGAAVRGCHGQTEAFIKLTFTQRRGGKEEGGRKPGRRVDANDPSRFSAQADSLQALQAPRAPQAAAPKGRPGPEVGGLAPSQEGQAPGCSWGGQPDRQPGSVIAGRAEGAACGKAGAYERMRW